MFGMKSFRRVGLWVAPVILAAPAVLAAQQVCGNGRAPLPTVGVGQFHCQGGTCVVRGAMATSGRMVVDGVITNTRVDGRVTSGTSRPAFDFSVQPWLWEIDPDGPASGKLEDGDRLLAVNGVSITSTEAGRILGDLDAGDEVSLDVRRGSIVSTVEIEVGLTCTGTQVSVGPTAAPSPSLPTALGLGATIWSSDSLVPDPPAVADAPSPVQGIRRPEPRARSGSGAVVFPRVPAPGTSVADAVAPTAPAVAAEEAIGITRVQAGTLDIGLGCGRCQLSTGSGYPRWTFSDYPVVVQVEEGGAGDRGGLRTGDVITSVNGLDLLTPEGGERFGSLMAGERAELAYRRGDDEGVAVVVLRPRRED